MEKPSPENRNEGLFNSLGQGGGSLFPKSAPPPLPAGVPVVSDEAVNALRKNIENLEKKLSDFIGTPGEANQARQAAAEEAGRRVAELERNLSELGTRLSEKTNARENNSAEWADRILGQLRVEQNRLENFEKRLSEAVSNSSERIRLAAMEMELRMKGFEQRWADSLARHSASDTETIDALRERLDGLEKRLLPAEGDSAPGKDEGAGSDLRTRMLDMESRWSALGLILSRLDKLEKDINEKLENRIKKLEKVLTDGNEGQLPLVSLPRQISAIRTWIEDIRRELGMRIKR